ncbi:hypothetical protein O998_03620 [Anaplasma phagocytophilum str. Norway variant1]|uniref:Uncharacterized protein n=1 Tax=Anaplasma phagocytophilum str. Norway variant1 TaxID=1392506 RepID=A0A7H9DZ67_ANAPH|nr:hypothetical protein [Anaplasma phagocytophilum]QLL66862.1 hypothetical protein O998_03620 [Anaplasma phagocytophilum str. Norway variant1]
MALSEINRMSTQFYAVQPVSMRDCGIKNANTVAVLFLMVEYIYQAMLIDDHAADFFCKIICTFKVAKRFSSVAEYVLISL